MNQQIKISTAITLTGWSKRTFWRRFADGSVERGAEHVKVNEISTVVLDSILPHLSVTLTAEDLQLVLEADAGHPLAQCDLALLFRGLEKHKEALYWLELAIKQGDVSAMHWMGRSYVEGTGVLKDEYIGLMWIAKAAAGGHAVSQAQVSGLINGAIAKRSE
ncbi:tetratricopeptide repeat protein [Pseudoduganella sp. S-14]|jgi:uncharacterized protein|uniref:tetratricopeptide repeat protein n=1 Tax=unclassified Pseudoduganella TaxID=2637179 RepID=UPI003CEDCFD7